MTTLGTGSLPTLPTAPVAVWPGSPTAVDPRAVGVMTLLCLTWSLQQISLKAIAPQISPMLMVAIRSAVALVLLIGLMQQRGEGLARHRWKPGAWAGALFGLEYVLVSQALQLTHASHVVVFLYTAPIFAALGLHARLPSERLGLVQWAGIGLAFAGIAAAFLGEPSSVASGAGGRAMLGDALALLAGVAWGATTVTIRCSTLAAAPPTETLSYQLLGALVLLVPVAWLTGQWHIEWSHAVMAHLGFQSVIVSFASFLTWCWLLRRYLASQLGVFSFLTPLFGVVLGAWLLQERLEGSFIVGSAFVLVGIGLVSGHAALSKRLASAADRDTGNRDGRPHSDPKVKIR
ncbi:MAG: DMT family transporter [Piscinibacter sp.]|jgi:drug/metabolite transporter (DMT)-like permease|nr:DMT family transporter [Piscinibacter sp.]